jgi:hypothetical protein
MKPLLRYKPLSRSVLDLARFSKFIFGIRGSGLFEPRISPKSVRIGSTSRAPLPLPAGVLIALGYKDC